MFGFVTTRRHAAELASAAVEANRQRELRLKAEEIARVEVEARRAITAQYCALSDEHDQTVRRNQSLCAQLEELKDAAGIEARARRSAERIARLQKAVVRARKEAADAGRRASTLQGQLDDALGLNRPAIAEGAFWQGRREQRMRFDKPTAEEATA